MSEWTKKLGKWLSPEAAEKLDSVLDENSKKRLLNHADQLEKRCDPADSGCCNEPLVEREEDKKRRSYEDICRGSPIYRIKRDGKLVENTKYNLPVAPISNSPQQKAGRLDDEIKAKLDKLAAEAKHYKAKSELKVDVISCLEEENASLRRRIEVLSAALQRSEEEFARESVRKEDADLSQIGKLFE